MLLYFGRTPGSPPGLPGGGITGVLPVSGVGARISGSIPAGGHSTPSDFASLSPSGSWLLPVVAPGPVWPGGVTVDCGVQPAGGGLVADGGLEGDCAAPGAAVIPRQTRVRISLRVMQDNGSPRRPFPSRGQSLR